MTFQEYNTHPLTVEWRRKAKRLFAAWNRAEARLGKILEEKPRRPWYRLRMQRATAEYERAFDAIPLPPFECNEAGEYVARDRQASTLATEEYLNEGPR